MAAAPRRRHGLCADAGCGKGEGAIGRGRRSKRFHAETARQSAKQWERRASPGVRLARRVSSRHQQARTQLERMMVADRYDGEEER